jgi:hypothetical protein
MTLPWIDVLGFWLGIFLTFAILSYLYKDNPFYRLAEHLFVGVSIGYVVTQQLTQVLRPMLLDRLQLAPGLAWIALALVVLLFLPAASRRLAWASRYPVAFVVALYAGIQINAVAEADLARQIAISTRSLVVEKVDLTDPTTTARDMVALPGFSPQLARAVEQARARGEPLSSLDDLARLPDLGEAQRRDLDWARGGVAGLDAQASIGPGGPYWLGVVSRVLLLVGLIAALVYFTFSIEHRGVVRKVARFGLYVLMVGFGASFGLTVQGRLTLATSRVMDVLDRDKPPEVAAQVQGPVVAVVVIVFLVVGILLWEKFYLPRRRPRE